MISLCAKIHQGSLLGGRVDPSKPFFKAFLAKLRKRHIIETLAAFIGGGWLLKEVVERLLVGHYLFPAETIDLTVVTVTCVSKESAK
jgi:hypothetical protein